MLTIVLFVVLVWCARHHFFFNAVKGGRFHATRALPSTGLFE
jgi:hypothetical protein